MKHCLYKLLCFVRDIKPFLDGYITDLILCVNFCVDPKVALCYFYLIIMICLAIVLFSLTVLVDLSSEGMGSNQ